jgi:hypothetical protein
VGYDRYTERAGAYSLAFAHISVLLYTAGSLATLILPAAIYLKVMPPESDMYRTAQVLLVVGFAVMFAVVIVTIIGMI